MRFFYLSILCFCSLFSIAQTISTTAGISSNGYYGDNGLATAAWLPNSYAMVRDNTGNIYLTSSYDSRIRKIDGVSKIISTYGGGNGSASYIGGDGQLAIYVTFDFSKFSGLSVDNHGNLYIGDFGNNMVHKIDASTGIVTTIAGTGVAGYAGDGGVATAGLLNGPEGIAIDAAGNIYINDQNNFVIRKIDAITQKISTIAGNQINAYSGDGGLATNASFGICERIVIDINGNLLIADKSFNVIRKVDAITKKISTIAGNGQSGYSGDGGLANAAKINIMSITVDASNNIYIGDPINGVVRKINATTNIITTVTGTGTNGFSGDGGLAISAKLNLVSDIVVDNLNNIYVSDIGNNKIREVNASTNIITTIAGVSSNDNITATNAFLNFPFGVYTDPSGNFYIVENNANKIRKVNKTSGIITTVAGTGIAGFSGDGGLAINANIRIIQGGITFDKRGNLFFADMGNQRIRRVDAITGIISTVAGGGNNYNDGISATSAFIAGPRGVAIDGNNNLYIVANSGLGGRRIRKIDAVSGLITTLAGTKTSGFNGDSILAVNAQLNLPQNVTVDKDGNIYIPDKGNYRIRKITASTGIITTVAGNGTSGFSGDGGLATSAQISGPWSVAVDKYYNIYFDDPNNNRVRRVDAITGIITTVAGNGIDGYLGDGGTAVLSELSDPTGVIVDSVNDLLYVCDANNQVIRKVSGLYIPPTINSFFPTSGSIGSLVTIKGTGLSRLVVLNIGGIAAIPVSNDGNTLVAMVLPGATTGAVSITTTYGTTNAGTNFVVTATKYPSLQQGNKLVGIGNIGAAQQGISVAISADGNTAIVGGYMDNGRQGAVWVFAKNNGNWTQQGNKLIGINTWPAYQGYSVAISADGNTVLIGGYNDDKQNGATWVFTRSNGVWSQQGAKLIGSGNIGQAEQGISVSLSADGNTALIGGMNDNNSQGAAWIFSRNNGVWTQQGSKLVGTGSLGKAYQGSSVAISSDGNTAIIGGYYDNTVGAAWIFTKSNGIWVQQGNKLVSTDISAGFQGLSVAINADGNTAIVGGIRNNSGTGAAWVYTRSGSNWTQQGSGLIGTGSIGWSQQGISVSISADGNTAVVGGSADNNNQGAVWIYTRIGSAWKQQGSKLLGSGNVGAANQGYSVALSSDGSTGIIGGWTDNSNLGAAWVFSIANNWTGNTSNNWSTPGNWSLGTVPSSSDNVIIPNTVNQPIITSGVTANVYSVSINSGGVLTNNGILNISNGGQVTVDNSSNLIVASGGAITGDYSNIIGNVTLQKNMIGQRGWRILSNPFTTNQVLSTVASVNNISINTIANASPTRVTDAQLYNNISNTWVNAPASIPANAAYSLFVRGLASEVNGTVYTGGPSAFTFSVSGKLNNAAITVNPSEINKYTVVGNPYAAPVNTIALTGGVSRPYYTFQIFQGISVNSKRSNAGGWVASSSNSSNSKTIPVLGSICYQPSSVNSFAVTTSDINAGGTSQNNLFGIEKRIQQLELAIDQEGVNQDKLFIRLDERSTDNSNDLNDLGKITNPEVINVYSIAPDSGHLAVDARNIFAKSIPIGITAPAGNYEFKVAGINLPSGTVVYLEDHLLNKEELLNANKIYPFTLIGDITDKIETRFSLSFVKKNTLSVNADNGGLTAKILGNPVSNNRLNIELNGIVTPVTINIEDLHGKLINTLKTINKQNLIDLKQMASGVYIVHISDGKTTLVQKLIKE